MVRRAKNITVLRDLMNLEPEIKLVTLLNNKNLVLRTLEVVPMARLAKQLDVPYGKFQAMVELMKQVYYSERGA